MIKQFPDLLTSSLPRLLFHRVDRIVHPPTKIRGRPQWFKKPNYYCWLNKPWSGNGVREYCSSPINHIYTYHTHTQRNEHGHASDLRFSLLFFPSFWGKQISASNHLTHCIHKTLTYYYRPFSSPQDCWHCLRPSVGRRMRTPVRVMYISKDHRVSPKGDRYLLYLYVYYK